jgi:hypothetical protein
MAKAGGWELPFPIAYRRRLVSILDSSIEVGIENPPCATSVTLDPNYLSTGNPYFNENVLKRRGDQIPEEISAKAL